MKKDSCMKTEASGQHYAWVWSLNLPSAQEGFRQAVKLTQKTDQG